ncbi:MAG: AraC family transcriptional regulator [Bacteroidaceae bacterium]|nr:AraC family transcriptional regulator [Bacteroidaceae bacterium]
MENNKRTAIRESDIRLVGGRTGGDAIDDELLLMRLGAGNGVGEDDAFRLGYILIGLCRQGRASLRLDTEEKRLYPGDLFLGGWGSVVGALRTSGDFEAQCILLSQRFFNDIVVGLADLSQLYIYTADHPVVALTEREAWLFSTYWDIIRERTADTENPYRTQLVRTQLLALIYEIAGIRRRAAVARQPASRSEFIFRDFLRLLEQHFRRERAVDFYAAELCISPKHLAHAVRRVSHQTPSRWIDNYVVREARRLLRDTTMSVKEVALALHFPNQSFFGTYFKSHTGQSPSAYRREG